MELSLISTVAYIIAVVQAQDFIDDCVFITVSSLWQPPEDGHRLVERNLELNWIRDAVCGSPDHLGLFSSDPRSTQDVTSLLWVETAHHPEGFYRTNISLGRPPLPEGWDDDGDDEGEGRGVRKRGAHCYPYWVASFNEIAILHAECLKIRPTWMSDNKAVFSEMSLHNMVLPGTHNSACYHHGNNTAPRRDAFSRYLLTQDADLWSQLVHGIRYLDLRVGYYATRDKDTHDTAERFWVNHAMVRVTSLLPVLRQVRRFLAASPDEIVIVDFHRFPIGLQGRRKRHRQLVAIVKKELGDLALPPPPLANTSYTLGEIWQQKRRLIVAYGEKQVAKDSKWLWPPLSQQWGSQQTPSGLRGYIDEVMAKHRPDPTALWSVMAELTPTPFDVLFDISGSLRQMADTVNRNLTAWIRDVWWHKANIVASDFFLGNHVIDVAVKANRRKAKSIR